ncbi:MAG: M42 family metallopeptidase [Oscillospiraceae bacterium]|nr:M42 family metallopeptidase [Oscillospiraceae bacterium]
MENITELIMLLSSLSGPSGHENEVREAITERARQYADEVKTDAMGNLFAVKRCGREGAPRVMLCAHMDEIGFIVTGYEKGCLRFERVGGVDARMLPAREIKLLTAPPVYGVVGVMPPHALSKEEQDKTIAADKLFIDVGMDEETVQKRVPLGTYGVYAEKPAALADGMLSGKALDNRSCCAVLLKVLESAAAEPICADLCFAFSVQEEVGLRGAVTAAYGAAPDYAIVTDVTFADQPDAPKSKTFKLGGGAALGVAPSLNRRLGAAIRAVAEKNNIPYQTEVMSGSLGTDAWPIQVSREGVATAMVSLPIRYMHTPIETLLVQDAENCVSLISQTLLDFEEVL